MSTLYLCGAGNSEGIRLALRVNERRGRWKRILLLDDDPAKLGTRILGVEVVGPFALLAEADPGRSEAVNLVARTTRGRRAAKAKIEGHGVRLTTLIHPDVDLMGARLEDDLIVYEGATIAPEVTLGAGSVVFMGAVVGHESSVGPGCVVASNAVLNARVRLGDGVYVGTNATVLPELRIGSGATIGAGSVVVQDVPPGRTVMGVPARAIPAPETDRRPPVARGNEAVRQGPAGGSAGTPGTPGRVKELERTLTRVWCEVLGRPDVDPAVNFFDQGGTSLGALQVVQRSHEATGLALDLVALFRWPTVQALARHLAGEVGGSADSGPRQPTFQGDLVSTVSRVFEDVLEVPGAGSDASFSEFGGTPTQARAMCERLREATGIDLCHMHVERFPTPRRLAEYMDSLPPEAPAPCPVVAVVRRQIRHEEFRRRGMG